MTHEEVLNLMLCNTCPRSQRENGPEEPISTFVFDLHCAEMTIEAYVASRHDTGQGATAQFTIVSVKVE